MWSGVSTSPPLLDVRYSNWPTVPQCYIDGEFVGGCDIMIEMHQSGELKDLLGKRTAAS